MLFGITKMETAKFLGMADYENGMPAYEKNLDDTEIIAVLSYIKSRWPERIRKRHDHLNAVAAQQGKGTK